MRLISLTYLISRIQDADGILSLNETKICLNQHNSAQMPWKLLMATQWKDFLNWITYRWQTVRHKSPESVQICSIIASSLPPSLSIIIIPVFSFLRTWSPSPRLSIQIISSPTQNVTMVYTSQHSVCNRKE